MNTIDMQARFHELGKQRAEIRAKADPIRAELEALDADYAAKHSALFEILKGIEAPLFDIDKERGALCRALNGKTGVPA